MSSVAQRNYSTVVGYRNGSPQLHWVAYSGILSCTQPMFWQQKWLYCNFMRVYKRANENLLIRIPLIR